MELKYFKRGNVVIVPKKATMSCMEAQKKGKTCIGTIVSFALIRGSINLIFNFNGYYGNWFGINTKDIYKFKLYKNSVVTIKGEEYV